MNTPASLNVIDTATEVEATTKEQLFKPDLTCEHVTKDLGEIAPLKAEPLKAEQRERLADAGANVESSMTSSELMFHYTQLNESLKELVACSKIQISCSETQIDMLKTQEGNSAAGLRYAKWGFWLGLVLIPIVTIFSAVFKGSLTRIQNQQNDIQTEQNVIQRKQDESQADIRKVARQVVANQPLAIIEPRDGKVGLTSIISGMTPFSGKNHYVVVTPVENGAKWIQDERASVDADGSFRGEAQFGEVNKGIGKKYRVGILVTDSSLPPGRLSIVPEDADYSAEITVIRQD